MEDSVRVIERVFMILEYLSQSNSPRGPTEISAATGIHKSTVYRLLTSMCTGGYIERTDASTYHIGVKLVGIVSSHISNLELLTEARPFLYGLHAETQLIVHLGILELDEVVYIEKMDINRNLRVYAQIGLRVPAFCSSLGKCLLSSLSGDEFDFLYQHRTLNRFTSNTITSHKELKEHLREVRRRGWALDNEEYIVGNRCVAAPIFDYRGEIIAAVSASGPTALLSDEHIPSVVEVVRQAAANISHRLCYQA
jgi:DNA-binding IclR family transcriptional regulator